MTVTADHQYLVQLIAQWCNERGDCGAHLVITDDYSIGYSRLPPTISGFRPDLVWMNADGSFHFIGEAKTRGDLANDHTNKQFTAFLDLLYRQESGTLIVAVPWGMEGRARSLLNHVDRILGGPEISRWTVISNAPTKARAECRN